MMDIVKYLLFIAALAPNTANCGRPWMNDLKIIEGNIGQSIELVWEASTSLSNQEIVITKEADEGHEYDMYFKRKEISHFVPVETTFPRYSPLIKNNMLTFKIDSFSKDDVGIYWAKIIVDDDETKHVGASRLVLTTIIIETNVADDSVAIIQLCIIIMVLLCLLFLSVVMLIGIRLSELEEMKKLAKNNIGKALRELLYEREHHKTQTHIGTRKTIDDVNWNIPEKVRSTRINIKNYQTTDHRLSKAGKDLKREHTRRAGIPQEPGGNVKIVNTKETITNKTGQSRRKDGQAKDSIKTKRADTIINIRQDRRRERGQRLELDTLVKKGIRRTADDEKLTEAEKNAAKSHKPTRNVTKRSAESKQKTEERGTLDISSTHDVSSFKGSMVPSHADKGEVSLDDDHESMPMVSKVKGRDPGVPGISGTTGKPLIIKQDKKPGPSPVSQNQQVDAADKKAPNTKVKDNTELVEKGSGVRVHEQAEDEVLGKNEVNQGDTDKTIVSQTGVEDTETTSISQTNKEGTGDKANESLIGIDVHTHVDDEVNEADTSPEIESHILVENGGGPDNKSGEGVGSWLELVTEAVHDTDAFSGEGEQGIQDNAGTLRGDLETSGPSLHPSLSEQINEDKGSLHTNSDSLMAGSRSEDINYHETLSESDIAMMAEREAGMLLSDTVHEQVTHRNVKCPMLAQDQHVTGEMSGRERGANGGGGEFEEKRENIVPQSTSGPVSYDKDSSVNPDSHTQLIEDSQLELTSSIDVQSASIDVDKSSIVGHETIKQGSDCNTTEEGLILSEIGQGFKSEAIKKSMDESKKHEPNDPTSKPNLQADFRGAEPKMVQVKDSQYEGSVTESFSEEMGQNNTDEDQKPSSHSAGNIMVIEEGLKKDESTTLDEFALCPKAEEDNVPAEPDVESPCERASPESRQGDEDPDKYNSSQPDVPTTVEHVPEQCIKDLLDNARSKDDALSPDQDKVREIRLDVEGNSSSVEIESHEHIMREGNKPTSADQSKTGLPHQVDDNEEEKMTTLKIDGLGQQADIIGKGEENTSLGNVAEVPRQQKGVVKQAQVREQETAGHATEKDEVGNIPPDLGAVHKEADECDDKNSHMPEGLQESQGNLTHDDDLTQPMPTLKFVSEEKIKGVVPDLGSAVLCGTETHDGRKSPDSDEHSNSAEEERAVVSSTTPSLTGAPDIGPVEDMELGEAREESPTTETLVTVAEHGTDLISSDHSNISESSGMVAEEARQDRLQHPVEQIPETECAILSGPLDPKTLLGSSETIVNNGGVIGRRVEGELSDPLQSETRQQWPSDTAIEDTPRKESAIGAGSQEYTSDENVNNTAEMLGTEYKVASSHLIITALQKSTKLTTASNEGTMARTAIHHAAQLVVQDKNPIWQHEQEGTCSSDKPEPQENVDVNLEAQESFDGTDVETEHLLTENFGTNDLDRVNLEPVSITCNQTEVSQDVATQEEDTAQHTELESFGNGTTNYGSTEDQESVEYGTSHIQRECEKDEVVMQERSSSGPIQLIDTQILDNTNLDSQTSTFPAEHEKSQSEAGPVQTLLSEHVADSNLDEGSLAKLALHSQLGQQIVLANEEREASRRHDTQLEQVGSEESQVTFHRDTAKATFTHQLEEADISQGHLLTSGVDKDLLMTSQNLEVQSLSDQTDADLDTTDDQLMPIEDIQPSGTATPKLSESISDLVETVSPSSSTHDLTVSGDRKEINFNQEAFQWTQSIAAQNEQQETERENHSTGKIEDTSLGSKGELVSPLTHNKDAESEPASPETLNAKVEVQRTEGMELESRSQAGVHTSPPSPGSPLQIQPQIMQSPELKVETSKDHKRELSVVEASRGRDSENKEADFMDKEKRALETQTPADNKLSAAVGNKPDLAVGPANTGPMRSVMRSDSVTDMKPEKPTDLTLDPRIVTANTDHTCEGDILKASSLVSTTVNTLLEVQLADDAKQNDMLLTENIPMEQTNINGPSEVPVAEIAEETALDEDDENQGHLLTPGIDKDTLKTNQNLEIEASLDRTDADLDTAEVQLMPIADTQLSGTATPTQSESISDQVETVSPSSSTHDLAVSGDGNEISFDQTALQPTSSIAAQNEEQETEQESHSTGNIEDTPTGSKGEIIGLLTHNKGGESEPSSPKRLDAKIEVQPTEGIEMQIGSQTSMHTTPSPGSPFQMQPQISHTSDLIVDTCHDKEVELSAVVASKGRELKNEEADLMDIEREALETQISADNELAAAGGKRPDLAEGHANTGPIRSALESGSVTDIKLEEPKEAFQYNIEYTEGKPVEIHTTTNIAIVEAKGDARGIEMTSIHTQDSLPVDYIEAPSAPGDLESESLFQVQEGASEEVKKEIVYEKEVTGENSQTILELGSAEDGEIADHTCDNVPFETTGLSESTEGNPSTDQGDTEPGIEVTDKAYESVQDVNIKEEISITDTEAQMTQVQDFIERKEDSSYGSSPLIFSVTTMPTKSTNLDTAEEDIDRDSAGYALKAEPTLHETEVTLPNVDVENAEESTNVHVGFAEDKEPSVNETEDSLPEINVEQVPENVKEAPQHKIEYTEAKPVDIHATSNIGLVETIGDSRGIHMTNIHTQDSLSIDYIEAPSAPRDLESESLFQVQEEGASEEAKKEIVYEKEVMGENSQTILESGSAEDGEVADHTCDNFSLETSELSESAEGNPSTDQGDTGPGMEVTDKAYESVQDENIGEEISYTDTEAQMTQIQDFTERDEESAYGSSPQVLSETTMPTGSPMPHTAEEDIDKDPVGFETEPTLYETEVTLPKADVEQRSIGNEDAAEPFNNNTDNSLLEHEDGPSVVTTVTLKSGMDSCSDFVEEEVSEEEYFTSSCPHTASVEAQAVRADLKEGHGLQQRMPALMATTGSSEDTGKQSEVEDNEQLNCKEVASVTSHKVILPNEDSEQELKGSNLPPKSSLNEQVDIHVTKDSLMSESKREENDTILQRQNTVDDPFIQYLDGGSNSGCIDTGVNTDTVTAKYTDLAKETDAIYTSKVETIHEVQDPGPIEDVDNVARVQGMGPCEPKESMDSTRSTTSANLAYPTSEVKANVDNYQHSKSREILTDSVEEQVSTNIHVTDDITTTYKMECAMPEQVPAIEGMRKDDEVVSQKTSNDTEVIPPTVDLGPTYKALEQLLESSEHVPENTAKEESNIPRTTEFTMTKSVKGESEFSMESMDGCQPDDQNNGNVDAIPICGAETHSAPKGEADVATDFIRMPEEDSEKEFVITRLPDDAEPLTGKEEIETAGALHGTGEQELSHDNTINFAGSSGPDRDTEIVSAEKDEKQDYAGLKEEVSSVNSPEVTVRNADKKQEHSDSMHEQDSAALRQDGRLVITAISELESDRESNDAKMGNDHKTENSLLWQYMPDIATTGGVETDTAINNDKDEPTKLSEEFSVAQTLETTDDIEYTDLKAPGADHEAVFDGATDLGKEDTTEDNDISQLDKTDSDTQGENIDPNKESVLHDSVPINLTEATEHTACRVEQSTEEYLEHDQTDSTNAATTVNDIKDTMQTMNVNQELIGTMQASDTSDDKLDSRALEQVDEPSTTESIEVEFTRRGIGSNTPLVSELVEDSPTDLHQDIPMGASCKDIKTETVIEVQDGATVLSQYSNAAYDTHTKGPAHTMLTPEAILEPAEDAGITQEHAQESEPIESSEGYVSSSLLDTNMAGTEASDLVKKEDYEKEIDICSTTDNTVTAAQQLAIGTTEAHHAPAAASIDDDSAHLNMQNIIVPSGSSQPEPVEGMDLTALAKELPSKVSITMSMPVAGKKQEIESLGQPLKSPYHKEDSGAKDDVEGSITMENAVMESEGDAIKTEVVDENKEDDLSEQYTGLPSAIALTHTEDSMPVELSMGHRLPEYAEMRAAEVTDRELHGIVMETHSEMGSNGKKANQESEEQEIESETVSFDSKMTQSEHVCSTGSVNVSETELQQKVIEAEESKLDKEDGTEAQYTSHTIKVGSQELGVEDGISRSTTATQMPQLDSGEHIDVTDSSVKDMKPDTKKENATFTIDDVRGQMLEINSTSISNERVEVDRNISPSGGPLSDDSVNYVQDSDNEAQLETVDTPQDDTRGEDHPAMQLGTRDSVLISEAGTGPIHLPTVCRGDLSSLEPDEQSADEDQGAPEVCETHEIYLTDSEENNKTGGVLTTIDMIVTSPEQDLDKGQATEDLDSEVSLKGVPKIESPDQGCRTVEEDEVLVSQTNEAETDVTWQIQGTPDMTKGGDQDVAMEMNEQGLERSPSNLRKDELENEEALKITDSSGSDQTRDGDEHESEALVTEKNNTQEINFLHSTKLSDESSRHDITRKEENQPAPDHEKQIGQEECSADDKAVCGDLTEKGQAELASGIEEQQEEELQISPEGNVGDMDATQMEHLQTAAAAAIFTEPAMIPDTVSEGQQLEMAATDSVGILENEEIPNVKHDDKKEVEVDSSKGGAGSTSNGSVGELLESAEQVEKKSGISGVLSNTEAVVGENGETESSGNDGSGKMTESGGDEKSQESEFSGKCVESQLQVIDMGIAGALDMDAVSLSAGNEGNEQVEANESGSLPLGSMVKTDEVECPSEQTVPNVTEQSRVESETSESKEAGLVKNIESEITENASSSDNETVVSEGSDQVETPPVEPPTEGFDAFGTLLGASDRSSVSSDDTEVTVTGDMASPRGGRHVGWSESSEDTDSAKSEGEGMRSSISMGSLRGSRVAELSSQGNISTASSTDLSLSTSSEEDLEKKFLADF